MLELYSYTNMQSVLRKKNTKFPLDHFFDYGDKNFIIINKNLYLLKSEVEEIYEKLPEFKVIKKNNNKINIKSADSYKDFFNKMKSIRHKNIIIQKNEEEQEKKYLENLIEKLKDIKSIAAIDCEYNDEEITELGILIYNLVDKEFTPYHFSKKRNKSNPENSPYKNRNLLSLTNVTYVSDLNVLKDKIKNILDDQELIVGHAVKNDKDRMSSYNLYKINNGRLFDTQKCFYNEEKEVIGLKDAILRKDDNWGKDLLQLKNKKNFSNFINGIKNYYKGFEDDNLINGIAIHNAFNDAYLSLLLLDKLIEEKIGEPLIEKKDWNGFNKKCMIQYNKNVKKYLNEYNKKVKKNGIL
mgnify:CR=1 FL=1|tara:strand:- start:17263 stop:18324 length:1062 start_codon:yes stop_codon:yes gene_type:complete